MKYVCFEKQILIMLQYHQDSKNIKKKDFFFRIKDTVDFSSTLDLFPTKWFISYYVCCYAAVAVCIINNNAHLFRKTLINVVGVCFYSSSYIPPLWLLNGINFVENERKIIDV